MAIAAFVALIHDLVITTGIYALAGFRGQPGDRHRPADHPGLLAVRHRGRLRQGTGEHGRPARRSRRPTARRPTWPSTRPWSGRSTPHSSRCSLSPRSCSSRRPARRRRARGTRAGAVRRHAVRYVLLDLHRHPGARDLKEREPQYKALAKRVGLRASGGRAAKRARPWRCVRLPPLRGAPADDHAADATSEADDDTPTPVSRRRGAGRGRANHHRVRVPRAVWRRPSGPRQQPRRTGSAGAAPTDQQEEAALSLAAQAAAPAGRDTGLPEILPPAIAGSAHLGRGP